MTRLWFWLRWSGRDLRQRWLQVGALALVIALGVGTWAGLGGTARWRRVSNDRSLAALAVHDLRVQLVEGSFVDRGELLAAVSSLLADGTLAGAEERLVVDTQVDASTAGHTVLAPGQLIGVDLADGGPHIDRFDVRTGTGLTEGAVALDVHFAKDQDLAPSGQLRLAGGVSVPYVGQVLTPDHFIVVSDRGGFFAGNFFAVVYASLTTAGQLSGHAGQVDELVLTVPDGADMATVEERVTAALATAFPGIGTTSTPFAEDPVHRFLYDDIDSDQRFYDIFAGLIFAGAVFGAFNLARRMVEAQRREIGISMALGTPSRYIALRPLLVGVEIAVIGTAAGIGVGLLVAQAMRSLFEEFLPLPVWETGIDWAAYLKGAAAGVLVPIVGLAWPVAKALRVTPMETMQPAYRRRVRRAPRHGRALRLPGSTLTRIPVRNVLRSAQRTVLTVLAIGTTSAVFFAILGMLDSFHATIDQGAKSTQSRGSERLIVDLDQVMPMSSATVAAVQSASGVADVGFGLRVPGALLNPDGTDAFGVIIEIRDLTGGLWKPDTKPVLTGDVPVGVVLAHKAADDLHVSVGDSVTLRHPRRTGISSFEYVTSAMPVLAIHEIPLRTEVLFDISHADTMNLAGLVNSLDVEPVAGVARDDVKRALFPIAGVASVQGVGETVEVYEDLLNDFLGFLLVVEGATLVIVALVAFNATSINVDERRREHATMMAFGLPVRTVLRTMVVENLILGLMGGLLGVGLGAALVNWLLTVSVPDTMPDIAINTVVQPSSVLVALAAATITVTLTPLTALRRLRRLDVSSTLRVVE